MINVGTATLGALIGAGGFGQPILTGIRLDDFGLILAGRGARRGDGAGGWRRCSAPSSGGSSRAACARPR